MAASEEKLQQIFAQAPVAILLLRGPDFVVELANPTYQALLPGRKLLGRPLADVVPELQRPMWDAFHQVFDKGEPFIANDWLTLYDRDLDGVPEEHWFNVAYQPWRQTDGTVCGLLGVLTDVTPQVRARQELERVNRELEEFAYVASHDIQEPLRMVNIYSHLVLKRIGSGDSKLQQYGEYIRQGVVRMEALIRDLLAYSRAIHRDPAPIGSADLSASLREALSVLGNSIDSSAALITTQQLPCVRGDTKQVTHVFQNLISNALKYCREGVRPEIQITAQSNNGHAVIAVQDNGIGFEQKYGEQIFALFNRLHKDEYPGTGVGLAICHRIVERYGGSIWAEGRPGEGSTFYFSLPCNGMV